MHIFGFEETPLHTLSCTITCAAGRDKRGERFLFSDLEYLAVPKLTKEMRNMLIHKEWLSLFHSLNAQNAIVLNHKQVMESYYDPEKMRQFFT